MAYLTHSKNQRGVALFMVIAAITVLTLLVTEFVYVAQINRKMAYDGLHQVKALNTARIGLKLSLLRLKAYQNLVQTVNSTTGAAGAAVKAAVPRKILELVWRFPFVYPIPALPGMTVIQKDAVAEFEKESGIEGSFSATIQSESSKFNLNMILQAYAPKPEKPDEKKKPDASDATPSDPNDPDPQTGSTDPKNKDTAPAFSPEKAREALQDYLFQIFNQKALADQDFADEYADFRVEEFVDSIVTWADLTYEQRFNREFPVKPKRAPFYSLSELHLLPQMDDKLYDLFAPNLTVVPTPGINVNTMDEVTLKALVPNLTKEEVAEFFKQRDNKDEDNQFKKIDDFYNYMKANFSVFAGNEKNVEDFKKKLAENGLRLVVDEFVFKIVVQAQVEQAIRIIEAVVVLSDNKANTATTGGTTDPSNPNQTGTGNQGLSGSGGSGSTENDPGLRITSLRII